MLILFMLLVTLGSYVKIKFVVIIVYLVITAFLSLMHPRKMASDFVHSPVMICWVIYCVVGFISTVFIEHETDLYIVQTQLSFTFILFVLTRYAEPGVFLRMFRLMMLVLSGAAFFQEITGIFLFRFLKEGTPFPYVDLWSLGISSLFEYRHYFGCYLLLAFFSVIYYPEKKMLYNLLYGAVFTVAIVLTYTRCIWIAFAAGIVAVVIRAVGDRIRQKGKREKKTFKPVLLIPILLSAALLVLLSFVFRKNILSVFANIKLRLVSALDPTSDSVRNRLFSVQHGTAYLLSDWQRNIWIGMGYGSPLRWLQTAEGASFRDAIDCQYVQTFMETGLIGLGSLIAMTVYSVSYFFRAPDRKSILFSLGFLMMAMAYFFFEVIVVSSSVFALWSLIVAYLCTGREGRRLIAEETLKRHPDKKKR